MLTIKDLENLNPSSSIYNNNNIINTLKILNNPQQHYQVIHIAGTNGKGSTTTIINDCIINAGFKTCKYVSPYIKSINETITVNNVEITTPDLLNLFNYISETIYLNKINLSSFEMLTVIMFEYAKRNQVDFLILETGIGGRFDATNVVSSLYTVITNISLEHTNWLGDNLKQIAWHKCGIIKNSNKKVIIADNGVELNQAINEEINKLNNKIEVINILQKYDFKIELDWEKFMTIIKINNKTFYLSLFGYHQGLNFLCAYEVLKSLNINDTIIGNTIKHTNIIGRLQKINDNPTIIIDATHNLGGANQLYNSITNYINKKNSVIICSILKDKDISSMLIILGQISENIIFTNVDNERGAKASDLQKIALKLKIFQNILSEQYPSKALEFSQKNYNTILITGSIYLLKDLFLSSK